MRRALVAATAAVIVLSVSACTPPVPEVSAAPSPSAAAAVVDSQVARIVPETSSQLAAADTAMDVNLLTNRVGGNAKIVRGAEYTQQKADKAVLPDVIPSKMQAVYVSGADTWPRLLVGVTEQPSSELTPIVMQWVQDSVSDDYQLRGWAHMIPAATLPAMAGADTGAAQLSLTDPDISPTPKVAVDNYIKLLQEGETSTLNTTFAPDTYRDQLFTARTVLTGAAKKAGGTYSDTITSDEAATYAMQTADGGALVFVPVTVVSTFTVKNAKVSIPPADLALLVGPKLTNQVVHSYLDVVVMYIPGPGVGSIPGVVAAEHNLVRVSAK